MVLPISFHNKMNFSFAKTVMHMWVCVLFVVAIVMVIAIIGYIGEYLHMQVLLMCYDNAWVWLFQVSYVNRHTHLPLYMLLLIIYMVTDFP